MEALLKGSAPPPSAYQCLGASFSDTIIPRGYSIHESPTLVIVPLRCECVQKEVYPDVLHPGRAQ